MKRQAIGALLAVSIVFAGCSGKSGSLPPVTTTKPASKTTMVLFTMHWPRKASATHRKPKYISPSTQSVIISVNSAANPPGPTTFANISSATGNPPTSTININAPIGSDDFIIQLYDAQQTAGETAPSGNLVGQTEVAQTINAGQLNTINATIDGVAYGVSIAPLANQPTIEVSQSSGFNIVGAAPVTFQVNALDADGNVIVPPGNAPTTTLAPYGSGVSVAAISGSANQYTVQVTTPTSSTSFPSVYATASDSYGDTANSIINIAPVSAIYIGYGSGGVALYDGTGNAITLPSGAFGGVQNAVAMAYDYDDNYVFVADAGQGKLLAFDALGNPISGFTAPAVAGISGVTYDSNNKTVYAVGTSGISSFTTTGAAGPTAAAVSNMAGIAYVAADKSSNPLTELAAGLGGSTPSIGIYNEAGLQTATFTTGAAPTGVAYAPYFVGITQQIYDARSGNVDGFDTSGGSAVTIADANNPFGIAVDANTHDVYVTEHTTNAIVPYLPGLSAVDSAAASITTPSASGMTNPSGITIAY